MGLELYMVGLMSADMGQSLEFYRRLGLDIPEGSESKTHVEIKMGNMTFFLDSNPKRWDPDFASDDAPNQPVGAKHYPSVLEFYLKDKSAVEAKYQELTGYGYPGHRAPYVTSFNMVFALIKDPDGNMILLSGDNR